MAHYAVRESPPLRGEIPISTSKNAVLPIMCGALLTGEDVRIERVPCPPASSIATIFFVTIGICSPFAVVIYFCQGAMGDFDFSP